nr:hypothetical protein [Tanacetum cinerariifolium]
MQHELQEPHEELAVQVVQQVQQEYDAQGSDKETRIKSTKRERVKIIKVHSTTQSEDHNSATEDISPNLISEVCNSQPNEPHDEFAKIVNTVTESKPTNEDVQEQGESIVEPA